MMMFSVGLIFLSWCRGQELNDVWKPTNEVLKTVNLMYENMAHTVADAKDKEKRAYSIMLTGLLQSIASGGNRTAAAVDLSQPADVIAANTVSQIDTFRTVLDPAINAVKSSCPPQAPSTDCSEALISEELKQTQQCSGFPDHRLFRLVTEDLVSSEEWQSLASDMLTVSKTANDTAAVQFIAAVEDGQTHQGVMPKLEKWFRQFTSGEYPCNLPPTLYTTTQMLLKKFE